MLFRSRRLLHVRLLRRDLLAGISPELTVKVQIAIGITRGAVGLHDRAWPRPVIGRWTIATARRFNPKHGRYFKNNPKKRVEAVDLARHRFDETVEIGFSRSSSSLHGMSSAGNILFSEKHQQKLFLHALA